MVDPVINGVAGAMASKATGQAIVQVKEALSNSDDEEEAWYEIARECAIQARKTYYYHIDDLSVPDREDSRELADSVGEVAHDIAIRGELEGYDEDDIQLVRDLAQRCKVYSNASTMSRDIEYEYKEDIDKLTERIFEITDRR